MKEGWEYKSLGDVCEILDSRRKPITKNKRESGTIPYYGATGILDYVKDYIFDEKLVLLGEDGAKWGAGENSAYIVEGKTWVNNHAHALRPKRELLIDELLVYYLNFANLQPFITGVTVPKLNQEKMRSIEIPVPSLPEQQSIVDYLDSAFATIDAMKANAEKALNEAKALFQASLKEMLEPKEGWEEDTLSNCCIKAKNIKWGKDTPSHKYIDLSSVDRETSQIYNTIVVTPQDAPSRAKQIVTKGDIIFATTRPTLRRVALICENYDGEICSTGFCVLRPKNHISSKWIFYLLKADRFYNYIEPLQSGANYPAVTDYAVKGYVIPIPPISEQQSIVAKAESR